jgi:serine/threonine-protein kinase
MALGGHVWTAGKILVLLGVLVATFFLSATFAMQAALRARQVQVPQLVGRTIGDASQRLSGLNLVIEVDEDRQPDRIVPEGLIMQQDPGAGVQARTQRTVRVWLSAGRSTTTVPELTGQTERTARIRLRQESFSISSVAEFRSPDYTADAIVAQNPLAASVSTDVSLLVNRGEQATTFVMSDVIGMDGLLAAAALRAQGFRVTIVGSQPYAGVPPGTVVGQDPAGGFQVGADEPIAIEISR